MKIKFTPEFSNWLYSLRDEKAKSFIARRLIRIQDNNFGDHKVFSKGLYEIRLHYGPGYRLYGIKKEKVILLLLCGGDKSTQNSDIKLAYDLLEKYKNAR